MHTTEGTTCMHYRARSMLTSDCTPSICVYIPIFKAGDIGLPSCNAITFSETDECAYQLLNISHKI